MTWRTLSKGHPSANPGLDSAEGGESDFSGTEAPPPRGDSHMKLTGDARRLAKGQITDFKLLSPIRVFKTKQQYFY